MMMMEVTVTVAVEKLSVSLDQEVVARARRAAELEGMSLSAWLSKAAEQAISLAEAKQALDEYVSAYGELDEAAAPEINAKLDAAGLGQPVPTEELEANRAALARLRSSYSDVSADEPRRSA
jgi:hypothetical protein